MQVYKLKGNIDQEGHLVIIDPIALAPGDVEVIILQSTEMEVSPTTPAQISNKQVSKIKAFEGLFENAPPVPPNFDADQAKWEYLKEKYNL